MKLNELRDVSFEIAKSKGWHDPKFPEPSFGDSMALVISELAEALEEHRLGKPARNIEYVSDGKVVCAYAPRRGIPLPGFASPSSSVTQRTAMSLVASGAKPCGVVIELVDALIRIGHIAGRHAIDLETSGESVPTWRSLQRYPSCRESNVRDLVAPHESDPASFGSWICRISWELACADGQDQRSNEPTNPQLHLMRAAVTICRFANWLGIPGEEFESAIEIKHAYNRTREFRHGNKKL